jgi:hypothetical protein
MGAIYFGRAKKAIATREQPVNNFSVKALEPCFDFL